MLTRKNIMITDEELDRLGELYQVVKTSVECKTFEKFIERMVDLNFQSIPLPLRDKVMDNPIKPHSTRKARGKGKK